jgi:hypothetical protein
MTSLDKNQFLILTIVEAVYVVYIMNFFKTRYSLAHPFSYFENKFLYHPIGKSDKPICNICPLGNWGSVAIAIYIILRWIIYTNTNSQVTKTNLRMFSLFVLTLVFLLSLLNFNAVAYLIPYFIVEIYVIKNVLK